jgi:fatty acid desaturase
MSAPTTGWIHTVRAQLQESPIDFFRVSPVRYWFDFLLSITLAYSTATLYLMPSELLKVFPDFSAPLWVVRLAMFPLAVFWLYRLGSLIHEVCHLGHHEMRVFKVLWNLTVGIVTLSPSPFFTRHHRDHHSQRMYGTPEDPEYIVNVFQPGSAASIAFYVLLIVAFPLIVFLRFFLAPLSFLHPKLREWTLTNASALTMNWRYHRKVSNFDRWAITSVELLCFVRAALIPAWVLLGFADWTRLPLLYSLGLGVLVLNQLRLLADHHFETDGQPFELDEHIIDSCNYTSHDFFTWLFFPFSIRYHALHHLFPSLPYHNLKGAHKYLVERLPADSPYRQLDQPSWWSVASRTLFAPQRPRIATAPADAIHDQAA